MTDLIADSVAATAPIEKRALSVARSLSAKLRSRVLNNFNGKKIDYDVKKFLRDEFAETLRDSMIVTHLNGLLVERKALAKQAPIALSVFDATIKNLTRQLNIDIADLQKQYNTQALKVIDEVSAEVDKKLRTTIKDLVSQGASLATGKKGLRQAFSDLGLTEKNGYQLENIYRTQTSIAFNAGKWEADQSEDIQEILWGYEYSAVGDDRTRPSHMALDGTVLPKEDPLWKTIWPPNGWGCRCVVIPVLRKQKIVRPKSGGVPDKGFNFNPGIVYSAA